MTRSKTFNGFRSLLKGIGQIMLQNNYLTGLFFLAGLFISSPLFGLVAIVSMISGTVTARVLKFPKGEINDGLYGFNAALVGVALIYFYQPIGFIWLSVIVGSVITTLIMRFFIKLKIPAFTFPFILVVWLLLILFYYFPDLAENLPSSTATTWNRFLSLFANGFGQVIFQNNLWAGLLFIAGVAVSSPVGAFYGIISIAISAFLVWLFQVPEIDIFQGIFGYNAVLCALVFADKKGKALLWVLLSVLLSVFIILLMRQLNLPALTFPFVLATWITLAIKNIFQNEAVAAVR